MVLKYYIHTDVSAYDGLEQVPSELHRDALTQLSYTVELSCSSQKTYHTYTLIISIKIHRLIVIRVDVKSIAYLIPQSSRRFLQCLCEYDLCIHAYKNVR